MPFPKSLILGRTSLDRGECRILSKSLPTQNAFSNYLLQRKIWKKKFTKVFCFFFLNIYNEPWPFKIPLVTLSGFMFFHQYKLTWQGTFKSVITLNSIITSINVIEKLLFVVQGCNTRNLNSVKTQISESELILINSHISIINNILNYGLNNSTTDMSTSTTYSNYKT